jgi:WbqC-like protein family
MTRTLVVSQPMFLPWVGLFEQVRLSDVFIHYDDVQLPQGRSFMSRVQIKSAQGVLWLTAPVDRTRSGKLLKDVMLFSEEDWRAKHLKTIKHAYSKAPYFSRMFELVENIYAHQTDHLSEFNINAIERLAAYLGLSPQFMRSSELGVEGSSTQRLVDLCKLVSCDSYVTGHGALNYLEHEKFEETGISVRYMAYKKTAYPQRHGEFTPYVSIIDAIANCGEQARELLASEAIYWREFNVS